MSEADKPYSVSYWGSHPDEDNDDCFTGRDFDTKEEAETFFNGQVQDPPNLPGYYLHDVAFIEIDGPDVNEVRANPDFKSKPATRDDSWQREIANEAGMLHGIEAFNEEMGYD